jgi:hypothetical protein
MLLFQDTDGKIISQCSGTKTAKLEEGSRLFVGSKEVEVTPERKILNLEWQTITLSTWCQIYIIRSLLTISSSSIYPLLKYDLTN